MESKSNKPSAAANIGFLACYALLGVFVSSCSSQLISFKTASALKTIPKQSLSILKLPTSSAISSPSKKEMSVLTSEKKREVKKTEKASVKIGKKRAAKNEMVDAASSENIAGTYIEDKSTNSSLRHQQVSTALNEAFSYHGTPHRMGGLSKKGIDCSGLMWVAFQKADVALPRSSHEMAKIGTTVKINELVKGDLVFFSRKGSKRITHVGMVSAVNGEKDIRFIHTSTSQGVREDSLFEAYWKKNFVKATRPL